MVFRFVLVALVALVLALLFALPAGIAGRRLKTSDTAEQRNVNVAQINGFNTELSCPGPAGTFSDTDLQVTLQTTGRPVIVTAQMQANLEANSGIAVRAVIDGQPKDFMDSRHSVGTVGETTTLTYTRVFQIDRGTHSYGIQCSGSGDSSSLGRRWLSVYEIR